MRAARPPPTCTACTWRSPAAPAHGLRCGILECERTACEHAAERERGGLLQARHVDLLVVRAKERARPDEAARGRLGDGGSQQCTLKAEAPIELVQHGLQQLVLCGTEVVVLGAAHAARRQHELGVVGAARCAKAAARRRRRSPHRKRGHSCEARTAGGELVAQVLHCGERLPRHLLVAVPLDQVLVLRRAGTLRQQEITSAPDPAN